MATLIPEAPVLALDNAAATRVWNWVLARQGLADSRRLATAWDVANAVLGLHAARQPSPFGIVAARTGDPTVPLSLFTGPVRNSLLTVRCMRKTLHALRLPLAAAAHRATLRFRERDALRAVHNAGYDARTIDALIVELCALLESGSLPYRVLESLLTSTGCAVTAARLAIKLAWERGILAYVNATNAWNRESRTFTLTATAYPALSDPLSRGKAIEALVTAYFERYGPASIRDASWWSGLASTDIATALSSAGRTLVAVTTPWSTGPSYMFASQVDEALGNRVTTGVQLLAHEDTALKAYNASRSRYLADVPEQRAFNQIGEVLPTVIIDGLVTGTWSWDVRTLSISTRLILGKTTAAQRHRVRTRAAEMTQVLRAAWAPAQRPLKDLNQPPRVPAVG
jgi:hypothetical protein